MHAEQQKNSLVFGGKKGGDVSPSDSKWLVAPTLYAVAGARYGATSGKVQGVGENGE